jgi:SAM-dependent methyltransferase
MPTNTNLRDIPVTETFQQEKSEYQATRRTFWNLNSEIQDRSWGGYYRTRLKQVYRLAIPEGASVLEIGCGRGDLLAALKPSLGVGVDFSESMVSLARRLHPNMEFVIADAHELDLGGRTFDYIVISDVVNDLWDVQAVFDRLRGCCKPQTRLIFNYYSHLWGWALRLAQKLGITTPNLPQNWLTRRDMINLLELSGFQTLRSWEEVVVPLRIPLISDIANRYLPKISPFRFLSLTNFLLARPNPQPRKELPTVSVIVAARNEEGHIAELMARIPEMGGGTEIVFVEGHSSDDTYSAIEREIAKNPRRRRKLLKQPGKGKGDAVRAGFAAASGDILMILDADITVPPEDLTRFYNVIASGEAEFVNGVRLVYPIQDGAMRFANLVGNKFFSWAFSWLLGQPIRDTLCGTKVLWADDYQKLADNRTYFGDFDPFGDFDLLFGAAKLNLKIMEVPIRYRTRRYGETNIQRWRHGVLLLRMVVFAARRIKFV